MNGLATQLKERRKELGFTQNFVAAAASIGIPSLIALESGKQVDMKVSTLVKLASALQVPAAYLLGEMKSLG